MKNLFKIIPEKWRLHINNTETGNDTTKTDLFQLWRSFFVGRRTFAIQKKRNQVLNVNLGANFYEWIFEFSIRWFVKSFKNNSWKITFTNNQYKTRKWYHKDGSFSTLAIVLRCMANFCHSKKKRNQVLNVIFRVNFYEWKFEFSIRCFERSFQNNSLL